MTREVAEIGSLMVYQDVPKDSIYYGRYHAGYISGISL